MSPPGCLDSKFFTWQPHPDSPLGLGQVRWEWGEFTPTELSFSLARITWLVLSFECPTRPRKREMGVPHVPCPNCCGPVLCRNSWFMATSTLSGSRCRGLRDGTPVRICGHPREPRFFFPSHIDTQNPLPIAPGQRFVPTRDGHACPHPAPLWEDREAVLMMLVGLFHSPKLPVHLPRRPEWCLLS